MKVLVILSYWVLLCQFYVVLCDAEKGVNQDYTNNERTKRYHEHDCLKRKLVENKTNKTVTPTASKHVESKAKTVPTSVTKAKLPINESNEPKDIRTVNHILNEIATLAHNPNQTTGTLKIRHLVDEIDKLQTNKNVKSNDRNSEKKVPTSKIKETKNSSQEHKTIAKLDSVKKSTNSLHQENKDSINVSQTLLTNGSTFYNEIPMREDDETTTDKIKDGNLIEIEEHKYEEELTRSPYKPNTWQNYNTGIPYAYNINGHNIDNYKCNNYPLAFYEPYNANNGNYYANGLSQSNQAINQNNGDNMRYRKTWLDRNTIINTGVSNEQHGIINEERKEVTNIQNPEFYRKYYSVTQKQYSRNPAMQSNPYGYYVNPQCSKWAM